MMNNHQQQNAKQIHMMGQSVESTNNTEAVISSNFNGEHDTKHTAIKGTIDLQQQTQNNHIIVQTLPPKELKEVNEELPKVQINVVKKAPINGDIDSSDILFNLDPAHKTLPVPNRRKQTTRSEDLGEALSIDTTAPLMPAKLETISLPTTPSHQTKSNSYTPPQSTTLKTIYADEFLPNQQASTSKQTIFSQPETHHHHGRKDLSVITKQQAIARCDHVRDLLKNSEWPLMTVHEDIKPSSSKTDFNKSIQLSAIGENVARTSFENMRRLFLFKDHVRHYQNQKEVTSESQHHQDLQDVATDSPATLKGRPPLPGNKLSIHPLIYEKYIAQAANGVDVHALLQSPDLRGRHIKDIFRAVARSAHRLQPPAANEAEHNSAFLAKTVREHMFAKQARTLNPAMLHDIVRQDQLAKAAHGPSTAFCHKVGDQQTYALIGTHSLCKRHRAENSDTDNDTDDEGIDANPRLAENVLTMADIARSEGLRQRIREKVAEQNRRRLNQPPPKTAIELQVPPKMKTLNELGCTMNHLTRQALRRSLIEYVRKTQRARFLRNYARQMALSADAELKKHTISYACPASNSVQYDPEKNSARTTTSFDFTAPTKKPIILTQLTDRQRVLQRLQNETQCIDRRLDPSERLRGGPSIVDHARTHLQLNHGALSSTHNPQKYPNFDPCVLYIGQDDALTSVQSNGSSNYETSTELMKEATRIDQYIRPPLHRRSNVDRLDRYIDIMSQSLTKVAVQIRDDVRCEQATAHTGLADIDRMLLALSKDELVDLLSKGTRSDVMRTREYVRAYQLASSGKLPQLPDEDFYDAINAARRTPPPSSLFRSSPVKRTSTQQRAAEVIARYRNAAHKRIPQASNNQRKGKIGALRSSSSTQLTTQNTENNEISYLDQSFYSGANVNVLEFKKIHTPRFEILTKDSCQGPKSFSNPDVMRALNAINSIFFVLPDQNILDDTIRQEENQSKTYYVTPQSASNESNVDEEDIDDAKYVHCHCVRKKLEQRNLGGTTKERNNRKKQKIDQLKRNPTEELLSNPQDAIYDDELSITTTSLMDSEPIYVDLNLSPASLTSRRRSSRATMKRMSQVATDDIYRSPSDSPVVFNLDDDEDDLNLTATSTQIVAKHLHQDTDLYTDGEHN